MTPKTAVPSALVAIAVLLALVATAWFLAMGSTGCTPLPVSKQVRDEWAPGNGATDYPPLGAARDAGPDASR